MFLAPSDEGGKINHSDKLEFSKQACVGVGVLDDPPLVYLYSWFGLSGVRVSGGHLCKAEAPTEPAGETASPYELFPR